MPKPRPWNKNDSLHIESQDCVLFRKMREYRYLVVIGILVLVMFSGCARGLNSTPSTNSITTELRQVENFKGS